jgi:Spy/CpxP family protein refolding chaperone
MERTRFLTVVIVALLVINAGTLVYLFIGQSKSHHPPHKMRKGSPSEFIIEKLQLDEKQQEAFFELRDEHRSEMKEIHRKLSDTRDQYFVGLKTSTIDSTESRQLQQEIGVLMGQIHGATFKHFTKVRQLCKPEQQKLFDRFIDDILRAMAPPPPGGKRGHRPPPH